MGVDPLAVPCFRLNDSLSCGDTKPVSFSGAQHVRFVCIQTGTESPSAKASIKPLRRLFSVSVPDDSVFLAGGEREPMQIADVYYSVFIGF